ncbi:MAG: hypothetical protein K2Y01_08375 [Rhabdochlamydiaceae bacterium]|nr:hypothetical protein [Rhabdochlamydiaceae bacterium]
MSIARKHVESSQPKGPIQKQVQVLADRLNELFANLSRNKDYPALQGEIDSCAKEIISITHTHYEKIGNLISYLKNAIIDLTEVPYMHPQMQKIAFEVAIQAAIKNLESFISQAHNI